MRDESRDIGIEAWTSSSAYFSLVQGLTKLHVWPMPPLLTLGAFTTWPYSGGRAQFAEYCHYVALQIPVIVVPRLSPWMPTRWLANRSYLPLHEC